MPESSHRDREDGNERHIGVIGGRHGYSRRVRLRDTPLRFCGRADWECESHKAERDVSSFNVLEGLARL